MVRVVIVLSIMNMISLVTVVSVIFGVSVGSACGQCVHNCEQGEGGECVEYGECEVW